MDSDHAFALMQKRERLLAKLSSLAEKALQTKAQIAAIEQELRAAAADIEKGQTPPA